MWSLLVSLCNLLFGNNFVGRITDWLRGKRRVEKKEESASLGFLKSQAPEIRRILIALVETVPPIIKTIVNVEDRRWCEIGERKKPGFQEIDVSDETMELLLVALKSGEAAGYFRYLGGTRDDPRFSLRPITMYKALPTVFSWSKTKP